MGVQLGSSMMIYRVFFSDLGKNGRQICDLGGHRQIDELSPEPAWNFIGSAVNGVRLAVQDGSQRAHLAFGNTLLAALIACM